MTTPLYWIDGPWPGKLAIASRPRGGEWLDEELRAWRKEGVNGIVSAMTSGEMSELELTREKEACDEAGLWFDQFPIADRGVPESRSALLSASKAWDERLKDGETVLIHCRQGVGRSAMLAAFLLTSEGVAAEEAWRRIEVSRHAKVPDTAEQKAWIERAAAAVHLT